MTFTKSQPSKQAQLNAERRVSPATTEPLARGFIDFIGGPMGRFAQVGAQSFWTPLRVLLLVGSTFLSLGFMTKASCLEGKSTDNGIALKWEFTRTLTSSCYNDITPLYSGRGFDRGGFPYDFSWEEGGITRYLEYPVLAGYFQGMVGWISNLIYPIVSAIPFLKIAPGALYFMVTAFFFAIFWAFIIRFMVDLTGNRVWDTVLLAASPLLITYAFNNWDIPSIFFAIGAMWAVKRGHVTLAGILIGMGTAFKLWPLFILGAYIVLALRGKNYVPLLKMIAGAAVAWLVLNVPVYLRNPEAWGEFQRLNQTRGAEWTTIYAFLSRITGVNMDPEILNMVSLALFALSCLAILLIGATSQKAPRVAQLAFLIVACFLLFNKVWSPQYSLWLLGLAVLAVPNWKLIFTWGVIDMMLWPILTWHMLGEAKLGAPDWLLNVFIFGRDACVIAMMVLIIRQISGRSRDVVRDAHEGRDPIAGPFRTA